MEISLLQGGCEDFEVAGEPTAGPHLWILLEVPMNGEVLIAYVHFKLIPGQGAVNAAQNQIGSLDDIQCFEISLSEKLLRYALQVFGPRLLACHNDLYLIAVLKKICEEPI
jgi:hypothetical protein